MIANFNRKYIERGEIQILFLPNETEIRFPFYLTNCVASISQPTPCNSNCMCVQANFVRCLFVNHKEKKNDENQSVSFLYVTCMSVRVILKIYALCKRFFTMCTSKQGSVFGSFIFLFIRRQFWCSCCLNLCLWCNVCFWW